MRPPWKPIGPPLVLRLGKNPGTPPYVRGPTLPLRPVAKLHFSESLKYARQSFFRKKRHSLDFLQTPHLCTDSTKFTHGLCHASISPSGIIHVAEIDAADHLQSSAAVTHAYH